MPEAVLEFKAKDGAWYAGTATFEGPFLRVHFEHFPDEEDERWLPTKFKSLQDAKKMIRPASQPMQDSQCSSLRCGIFLCVACRRPDSDCFEYYDAKLRQIQRSPHMLEPDGQECCRCKFDVEWLGGPLQLRRSSVTCGDICLKTHGDIEDDPVIKEYLADVKCGKVLKGNDTAEKDAISTHVAEVICGNVLKGNDAAEKDAILALQKRGVTTSAGEKREQANSPKWEQSVSKDDYKGLDISLQYGEGSNQIRDYGNVKKEDDIEEQPLKKVCLDTQYKKESSEPPVVSHSLPCSKQSAKQPVDVIQIDSEEEDCKSSSSASRTQTCAVNDTSADKPVKGFDCSKLNTKMIPHKTSPSLADGFSTHHDFSGISKEQTFSCTSDVPECSCVGLTRHCFKGESCQCDAVGFIPITPFHLRNMCTHNMFSHRNVSSQCKWTRSANMCTHSTSSQICSQNTHFQADKPTHIEHRDDKDDIKENCRAHKANTRACLAEGEKGLGHTQFLLVENIEKDVILSKALQAIRKVTSDALMVYIWPSLNFETSRKGYICYKDFAAAEAAYHELSAENLFIVSRRGRPWVVSQTPLHKLDWSQMYSISAAIVLKQEDTEDGKETDGDLFILHKGSEAYTLARGRHKLFVEQRKKLRFCFQQFAAEDEKLETDKYR